MTVKKVLAIASGGGHWKQLMLIKDAFANNKVKYVTTIEGLAAESGISEYVIVKDSNQNEKIAVLICLFQIIFIMIKFRPHIVVTTGAAPGVLGIFVGRLIGSKTIWVDSVANSERLSMGGKISKKFAHIVLTQWEHLAEENIFFKGSVF